MNVHTHKQFDHEMEAVRSGVLAMGGLVESQLRRAIALLEADDRDAIAQVKLDEKQINQMQISLDQMCTQIIARRQPTAIDLRFVLMISKIVNELERVGDETKKIASRPPRRAASIVCLMCGATMSAALPSARARCCNSPWTRSPDSTQAQRPG